MTMPEHKAVYSHGILSAILLSLSFFVVSNLSPASDLPRPEHPRPDMQRDAWLNLNGPWEFAETDDAEQTFLGDAAYPDTIIVPFPRESELSGLNRTGFIQHVWYRRTFQMPATWQGGRVRLHIGAADWRTNVWVNGQHVGEHVGGSAPFAFEITHALQPGDNAVIIHCFDDTASGIQATGKQSHRPESHGAVYTRVTGIWQTVWLERVGSSFIRGLRITGDPKTGEVEFSAEVDGARPGMQLWVSVLPGEEYRSDTQAFGRTDADRLNTRVRLKIQNPIAWSIENPHLYNAQLQLRDGDETLDVMNTYFGLREITLHGAALLINGEPVFQRLVLDQGYYPDGIWTAPTDEALRRDIELSLAAGFNGARLHQKVFEPRFLYWADRLGYLVWGEFPNWGLNYGNPRGHLPVITEWTELVQRDRNHPAVIGWCPFNETDGAGPLQNALFQLTRAIDPTRPVIDTSGWTHSLPREDVLVTDDHDYNQDPESFRARWGFFDPLLHSLPPRYGVKSYLGTAFFLSEYGGIGWNTGEGGWGYGNNPRTLEAFYARYQGLTDVLLDNPAMFGFCYTQLYDIEQERNGIYTYDRKPKFDIDRIRAVNVREAAYEKEPLMFAPHVDMRWSVLVGSALDNGAAPWCYTTDPPGDGWTAPQFDASAWKTGAGGFGQGRGLDRITGTPWESSDIWIRQEFTVGVLEMDAAALVIRHDEDTEVYLNGTLIWSAAGHIDEYRGANLTDAVRSHLIAGRNVIAAHTHQTHGGQFIDLALLLGRAR